METIQADDIGISVAGRSGAETLTALSKTSDPVTALAKGKKAAEKAIIEAIDEESRQETQQ